MTQIDPWHRVCAVKIPKKQD